MHQKSHNDFYFAINNNLPLAEDFSADSCTALIAFGGIYGAMGMPPFEFFNLARDLPVNKVYIRDPHQAWYHYGLPGIAKNIDELAQNIRSRITAKGITNSIVVGNSMGGFASLLFGSLIQAQTVYSFSPQTFVNRFNRWWHKDERWQEQINKVLRLKDRKYLDLKKVLGRQKNNDCRYCIYYSPLDRLDAIHASRMKGLNNVFLNPCGDGGGHEVIKVLKDNGKLKRIILEALDL